MDGGRLRAAAGVCALAALTVRKHKLEGKNPIGAADLEWFLLVTMKILRLLII